MAANTSASSGRHPAAPSSSGGEHHAGLLTLPNGVKICIYRYVGAHTDESTEWSKHEHWRACGQSCGCCRSERAEAFGSCEACDDLWCLKVVSREMVDELRNYNGL